MGKLIVLRMPEETQPQDKCHSCKHHYLEWDWDNGHHSKCDLYDRAIPSPGRFDYPIKIPRWCEGKYERRGDENDD